MATQVQSAPLIYSPQIESALIELAAHIRGASAMTARSLGLLLLQGDDEVLNAVAAEPGSADRIRGIVAQAQAAYDRPLSVVIALERQKAAEGIIGQVVRESTSARKSSFTQILGTLAMRPLTGVPIALAILWACYQFVGIFGAGTLVGLLEENLFGEIVNPWLVEQGSRLLGLGAVALGDNAAMVGSFGQQFAAAFFNLFLGENGVITLGITYAVAIILPIVFTFFLFFSVLEDTGYFPRLALMVDRIFKYMGLNGRAVIPIVLGFGCDTMATMVTRIQESQRERLITIFLLSLAIPCSAQIGVILSLLSKAGIEAGIPGGVYWLWVGFMTVAFLVVGFLASKVIPGDAAGFYMEVPPLRWPVLKNILVKTFSRMQWYTLEIIPLFIWASVIIWALDLTGALHYLLIAIRPLSDFIGLPGGADGLGGAKVVLQGFFRRDYGAAGLYDFASQGILTVGQIFTACVVFTLFIPCIAQFMVMKKELGMKRASAMVAVVLIIAFGTGGILNNVLKNFDSFNKQVTIVAEDEGVGGQV